jgi:hypothetical protein
MPRRNTLKGWSWYLHNKGLKLNISKSNVKSVKKGSRKRRNELDKLKTGVHYH